MESEKQELARRMAALTQRLKDAMASRKAMDERASGTPPASPSVATEPSPETSKPG